MDTSNAKSLLLMSAANSTVQMNMLANQEMMVQRPGNLQSNMLSEQEKVLGCQACTDNQRQKRNKKRNPSGGSDATAAAHGSTASGQVRRNKTRSPGGTVKTDVAKGDIAVLNLHTDIQQLFASHLAQLLNDPRAKDLQCCVTYGKPCGCIRKFIIAGQGWKENTLSNLHIAQAKNKSEEAISQSDRASVQEAQVHRARELLEILHRAAELKKEKCYTVASEGSDGKPLKELRGMIGLGNGRKRSKKYEDYVLDKRSLLRSEYSLCEKAAQKLLGYSINFLYKKLRTNPQKTSRLVATNKAERASKVPRHLISLQQLQEMATNQQASSQCCCRNCISWLVKQHFDKIIEWRRRLEGSGQRVAQEIVAEVLLASASLDGQNSFCQNLVHWVTGCSFKKIRRVRDHLKKDPKSLPEHGLKKYWKDKASRNQGKAKALVPPLLAKSEKDAYGVSAAMDRFPTGYDVRGAGRTSDSQPQINVNNSNNSYDSSYRQTGTPNPPGNNSVMYPTPVHSNNNESALYSSLARHQSSRRLQQMYPPGQVPADPNNSRVLTTLSGVQQTPNLPADYQMYNSTPVAANNQMYQQSSSQSYQGNQIPPQAYPDKPLMQATAQLPRSSVIIQARTGHQREPEVYHNQQDHHHQQQPPQQQQRQAQMQPNTYNQTYRSRDEVAKPYPAPLIASLQESSSADSGQPSYYFAATSGQNHPQETFFHPGMTPLFLAQAQQPDANQQSQDNNDGSQFTGQSFFLLSPALPNGQEKGGFDYENWKQLGMPLTPIQMYPAPYFAQNNEGGEGRHGQGWNGDAQHFMFPVTDGGVAFGAPMDVNYADPNQLAQKQQSTVQSNPGQYFGSALTPLAVVPQGGFFSGMGWFAAPQQTSEQAAGEPEKSDESCAQAVPSEAEPTVANQGQKFFHPHESATQYLQKTEEECYEAPIRPQQLPVVSQWPSTSEQTGTFAGQQAVMQPTQWVNPQPEIPTNVNLNQSQQQDPTAIVSEQTRANNLQAEKLRRQMPPLAPLVPPTSTMLPEVASKEIAEKVCAEVPQHEEQSTSPKVASIADRSKRFSRDRLRATIDSPCLPPMTPLTPALTPVVTNSNTAGTDGSSANLPSTSDGKPADSSFFRFPPTHVSRRMAALRMQGHTTDALTDGTDAEASGNAPTDKANKDKAASSSTATDPPKATESVKEGVSSTLKRGTLESSSSLGYMSESILQGDPTMLADLNNVKSLPVLSLPSAGWTDDSNMNVTVKENEPDDPASQQLKTPTQVLNTPTPLTQSAGSPTSQLHTPNQPLNTPTQIVNTPNQLNTPTQPLNTPTHDLSPHATQSSSVATIVDVSPVKALQPVPANRKRKAESELSDAGDKTSGQKQIRFHHFTPKDFTDGSVNVSAFRKPSEYAPSASDDPASARLRRRNRRKQTNPQLILNEAGTTSGTKEQEVDRSDHSGDEDVTMERVDLEESPDKESAASKSGGDGPEKPGDNVMIVGNPMQFGSLQTPSVLRGMTPMFSLPTVTNDDNQSNPQQSGQLNTPVFIHSAALMTPSSRMNPAFLRRGSPAQPPSSSRTPTPQFFTFVPGSGFSTPTVFFAPGDQKKSKTGEGAETSEKVKQIPEKRVPKALTFSHPGKDDALQTPSKIQVVTPGAALSSAGLMSASEIPHIFSFHDPALPAEKQPGTSPDKEKSRKVSEEKSREKGKSPTSETGGEESNEAEGDVDTSSMDTSSKLDSTSAIPTFIVDPPSDGEESTASKVKKNKVVEKQTLHRVRSGGKTDLVLSLKPTPGDVDVAPSPLNTPSTIQVITPTVQSAASASKTGSPVKRLPQALRVHPQPLVMAPICMNPGGQNPVQSASGVQTPTLIHLISPSQGTPPSPSVLVYPYPPRGFGSISGPRTASPAVAGSPAAFGIIQRGSAAPGGNSGSLLKSALMKKFPVFQFPPPSANPPACPAPAGDKSETEETTSSPSADVSRDISNHSSESPSTQVPESSTPVSVICRPSTSSSQLTDKLSGANDPCLSEAAQ